MIQWGNAGGLEPKQFTCGHCNNIIGSSIGYGSSSTNHRIYICPFCGKPNYFIGNQQIPGVRYGDSVSNLPSGVSDLYDEARRCMAVSAYTASVMLCRKILMNFAVIEGASEGKRFIEYVQYISDKNYVPEKAKAWIDLIRSKGNEANHEIKLMERQDAEDLITFVEMLLKSNYEYPAKAAGKSSEQEDNSSGS